MASLVDFDQGGSARSFINAYLGPSIGWQQLPSSVFPITTPGTFVLQTGVTLVTVNIADAVVVKLPSAISPSVPAGVLPTLFIAGEVPITIVDVGGFAGAHPITIQPFSISESVLGLAQIQITIPYGAVVLQPSSIGGWCSF